MGPSWCRVFHDPCAMSMSVPVVSTPNPWSFWPPGKIGRLEFLNIPFFFHLAHIDTFLLTNLYIIYNIYIYLHI